MKRYFIPISIVLAILFVGLKAFGQAQEKTRQSGITRRDMQSLSPEERKKVLTQMRQRRGSSNFRTDQPEQLKALEAIQEQLTKFKTALQNVNRQALLNYENLSEEEKTKLNRSMAKSASERQRLLTTIEEKLPVIRGTRRTRSEEQLLPVRELKIIHQIATREKATQAARRLELLIARYEKESTPPGTATPVQRPQDRLGSERPARP